VRVKAGWREFFQWDISDVDLEPDGNEVDIGKKEIT
jgi:hypothetical protein